MPNSKNENQEPNLNETDLPKEPAKTKKESKPEATAQNPRKKAAPAVKKSEPSDPAKASDEKSGGEKKQTQAKKAAQNKPAVTEASRDGMAPEDKMAEDAVLNLPGENDGEPVDEELETIRNIIQEDVNKILEHSNGADWSELVKQAHVGESSDEPEEEDAEPEIDVKKVHYNFLSYFVIVLFLLVLSVMFFETYTDWSSLKLIGQADKYASQGKLTSSISKYEDAVSAIKENKGNITKRLITREIEVYYTIGLSNYDTISSLIEKYYTDDELDSFMYKKIGDMNDELKIFETTSNKASTIYSTVSGYSDFVKALDTAYKKSPSKYNASLVEYFKWYVAYAYDESEKTQLKHLEKAAKLATSDAYANLYYPSLAQMYLRAGKYDKVFDCTEKILETNKENSEAYALSASSYRMQSLYKQAVKECERGLKINKTDSGLNQQMAIILLLQGDYAAAENYASTAYKNSDSDSFYYSSNLYALCAHLNKDNDTYEEIEDTIVSYGYSVADDIAAIINGTKTLKEVFLDGDGDY